MHIIPDTKNISPADVERCRYRHQWTAKADTTVSAADTKDKIYFLVKAVGEDITLTNDGETIAVITGVGELETEHTPIRLSQNGWSIAGTVVTFLYGFYVPVGPQPVERPERIPGT